MPVPNDFVCQNDSVIKEIIQSGGRAEIDAALS